MDGSTLATAGSRILEGDANSPSSAIGRDLESLGAELELEKTIAISEDNRCLRRREVDDEPDRAEEHQVEAS